MTTSTKYRKLTIGLTAALLLAGGVGAASAGVTEKAPHHGPSASSSKASGWEGVTRKQVRIDLGKGWVTKAELTYPTHAKKRLPLVVMLHGSGHNDMNQTLPGGKGATFLPLAQGVSREGFATLRFNKRGVTGIGPVESKEQNQLNPENPYAQIQKDAASVIRFGAASSKVDASKIFLLGHSEGTNVAANLASDPKKYGIPKPAGVIAMGVVGQDIKELLTLQLYGRLLLQMHDEFDVDADGQLTRTEAVDGLVGQPKDLADQIRPVLLDGDRIQASTDTNKDGKIAIDGEAGAVLRKATGIDNYPDVPGLEDLQEYVADIARFPTVTEALPKFSGPTLLLNGENDLQTPARVALTADAAIGAAGNNKDHEVIIYPGMAHTMNLTRKFVPEFGDPDRQVVKDVRTWLRSHR
ncbi:alpha/beta hydrolase fold domain-containing protein [Aeromicrobium sp. SMF47]|uniref:Alpha/beta hydrolase fold domain-containing protein n=1 Tax=Aeromicrobium yanjiei TaxID=2662028 RepID=A0A5Q2MJM8_9ACTN|nr:alpha/beta hydrolase fold domain-containing protein [Aeromicrobium yanjiei]MRJ77668.1 alpha/beta hydrolase fold domain-containing protein [Aeromicrobium yanjiei]QGG41232.1 alpha/beta hydrolase fold domain-containing protein [Aeromicrobium yanjiei]